MGHVLRIEHLVHFGEQRKHADHIDRQHRHHSHRCHDRNRLLALCFKVLRRQHSYTGRRGRRCGCGHRYKEWMRDIGNQRSPVVLTQCGHC